MMLASGTWSVRTRFTGSTTSELGAMPIVHIMVAPIQTCIGIPILSLAGLGKILTVL